MFKQVKSALIWFYLYKFRKKMALVFTLFVVIVFSEYIYSDIVEYLKLRDKVFMLDFILPLKWIIIIISVFYIFYTIFSIFKKDIQLKDEQRVSSNCNLKQLSKKEIRDLAENIIKRKRNA